MSSASKRGPKKAVGAHAGPRILGLPPQQATRELAALYGRSKKIRVAVRTASYANLAFVQVSPRDVFIDFIQSPGTPQGDEVVVDIIRIYLAPAAAKSLSDVLGNLIENVRKAGQFEGVG